MSVMKEVQEYLGQEVIDACIGETIKSKKRAAEVLHLLVFPDDIAGDHSDKVIVKMAEAFERQYKVSIKKDKDDIETAKIAGFDAVNVLLKSLASDNLDDVFEREYTDDDIPPDDEIPPEDGVIGEEPPLDYQKPNPPKVQQSTESPVVIFITDPKDMKTGLHHPDGFGLSVTVRQGATREELVRLTALMVQYAKDMKAGGFEFGQQKGDGGFTRANKTDTRERKQSSERKQQGNRQQRERGDGGKRQQSGGRSRQRDKTDEVKETIYFDCIRAYVKEGKYADERLKLILGDSEAGDIPLVAKGSNDLSKTAIALDSFLGKYDLMVPAVDEEPLFLDFTAAANRTEVQGDYGSYWRYTRFYEDKS